MSNILHFSVLSSKERSHMNSWLRAGILLIMLLVIFNESIVSLINVWSNRPEYSHGFLIPFISLYMIYVNREKFKQVNIKPGILLGVLLTALACFMYLIGNIGSLEILLHLSLLLVLPGIVIMLFGIDYLKKLAYPLLYLIFMIPIIDIFLIRLHWPSQVVSAKAAAWMLHLVNIPVLRDINVLHLPNTSFEVAESCSGVRFFVSMLAVSIPLAYFTQKRKWQKMILITIGILIVIPINSIRIAMIGIWAYSGREIVHGPMHIFQGLFVAVVGFAVLIMFAYILNRLTSYRSGANTDKVVANSATVMTPEIIKQFNKAWVVACMLLLLTGVWTYLYKPIPVKLSSELIKLPDSIGNWETQYGVRKEPIFPIQNADLEVVRYYKSDLNQEVKVQISYFELQESEKELISYRLDGLYKNSKPVNIQKHDEDFMDINRTIYEAGTNKSLVLYWYDLNGRIISNNFQAKAISIIDGILRRRTNGAIILVSSNLVSLGEADKVFEYEADFVQQLLLSMPELHTSI